jgi:ABC-type transport system involved in multi-copper enzyme maturation permease subunit
MSAVYFLTLRQLTGRWRIIIMTVLAALPVLVAWIALRSSNAPSVREFELTVLSGMLAGSIAPLVVLAIAAAAFGNEVEDRTLANLTLSPVPRWQIALPKLLASFTIAAPFIAISAFATSHVAFIGDTTATIAVTVSALVGVALYSSLFVWLGLVSTQAIGIGLLYILLWEGFVSTFVSGARAFSIRHYATALMHGLDERRFAFARQMSPGLALAISIVVFAGFLWLSIRKLRRMDVP